jgi:hypothetical protein
MTMSEFEEYDAHAKSTWKIKKWKVSINWAKQGGLIISILIVHFFYWGLICNHPDYQIASGDELIWIWQTWFKSYSFDYAIFNGIPGIPLLILLLVCFYLTYKEDLYPYGIRNSMWLVPLELISGIFWFWLNHGISGRPFALLFGDWRGYLTIFLLIVVHLAGSVAGWKLKEYTSLRKAKTEER